MPTPPTTPIRRRTSSREEGHSAARAKKTYVILADYDGCFADVARYNERGDVIEVNTDHPLILRIISLLGEGHDVIFASATNRQSDTVEEANAARKGNGYAKNSFPHIISNIKTVLSLMQKQGSLANFGEITYDPSRLSEQPDLGEDYTCLKNKTDLILLRTHEMVKKYGANVHFIFIDDLSRPTDAEFLAYIKQNQLQDCYIEEEYLVYLERLGARDLMTPLQAFLVANPHLLPAGCQFDFQPYFKIDRDSLPSAMKDARQLLIRSCKERLTENSGDKALQAQFLTYTQQFATHKGRPLSEIPVADFADPSQFLVCDPLPTITGTGEVLEIVMWKDIFDELLTGEHSMDRAQAILSADVGAALCALHTKHIAQAAEARDCLEVIKSMEKRVVVGFATTSPELFSRAGKQCIREAHQLISEAEPIQKEISYTPKSQLTPDEQSTKGTFVDQYNRLSELMQEKRTPENIKLITSCVKRLEPNLEKVQTILARLAQAAPAS